MLLTRLSLSLLEGLSKKGPAGNVARGYYVDNRILTAEAEKSGLQGRVERGVVGAGVGNPSVGTPRPLAVSVEFSSAAKDYEARVPGGGIA